MHGKWAAPVKIYTINEPLNSAFRSTLQRIPLAAQLCRCAVHDEAPPASCMPILGESRAITPLGLGVFPSSGHQATQTRTDEHGPKSTPRKEALVLGSGLGLELTQSPTPCKVNCCSQVIEYDPNRNARIALLHYFNGEKRYILCPRGLAVGDILSSGFNVPIKLGNALPLKNIRLGTEVHNLELQSDRGGQLIRAAGCLAQIVAKKVISLLLGCLLEKFD